MGAAQSYRQVQEKESRLLNDLSLAQAQLFPLRKENARLARENHELHLDHIKQTEESRRETDRYAQKARELGDQITELRLMNKLYEQQVKEKDEVIEKLREAYEEISDPALKTKYIIGSHIKTSGKVNRDQLIVAAQNNSVVMNMWRAVQHNSIETNSALISTLQDQNSQANNKISELESQIAQLKSSLAAREQELSRTSKLIGNAAAKSSNIADSVSMTFGIDSSATEASNKRVIDQLNAQVDFLNGELAFREAQLATVQTQLSQFDSIRSELAIKSSAMEKLKEENNKLSSRVQFLENKVISLRSMAHTAVHTPKPGSVSFFSEAQLTPISEEKEGSRGFGSRDDDDDLDSHGPRIPSSFSWAGNTARMQELESAVHRLTQEKSQLQQELAQAQEKETSTVRRISATVRSASSPRIPSTAQSNALVVELNKEVEELRKKNIGLTKQLKDAETKVSYFKSKESSLGTKKSSTSSASSSSSVSAAVSATLAAELEAENAQLLQEIQLKSQQASDAVRERDRYAAMIDIARDEVENYRRESKEYQERVLVIQEECEALTSKYNEQSQRLRKAEVEARQVAREAKYLQEQLVEKEEDILQMRNQVNQLQDDRSKDRKVKSLVGTADQVSMQSSLLQKELQQANSQNDMLQRQVATLQAELKLLQSRLLEREHVISEAHEGRDQDTATVQLWKQQLVEVRQQQQQTVDTLVAAQMENSRLESKLTLLQRQLDETKSSGRQEQDVSHSLRQEKEILEQRNADLINLVKRLESQQQVSNQRVRSLEDVIQRLEDQVRGSDDQLQSLRKSLTEKETAVQKYRHLLEEAEITHENDESIISRLEEESAAYRLQSQQLQDAMRQTESLRQAAEAKIVALAQENQNLQGLVEDFDRRHQAIKLEQNELRQKLSQKMVSEGHAAEDLMLMTKENQALSRDLSVVLSERDHLRQQVREIQQQVQVSESARHALEIEKADLLENFRAVVKEKRRLEDDLRAVSTRQCEEVSVLQQLRQERDDLLSQVQVFQAMEERWVQERQAHIQQLEVVNDKLIQLQRRIDSLEIDNRRLMQEQHGWQQNNALLNDRNAVIMKRASAANEANKVLTSRLSGVEKERDALRALIEVERQRSMDMTKIAETARIEAATKDIQLQRLRTELEDLQQQHS
jgi:chromosome segregation ATPase